MKHNCLNCLYEPDWSDMSKGEFPRQTGHCKLDKPIQDLPQEITDEHMANKSIEHPIPWIEKKEPKTPAEVLDLMPDPEDYTDAESMEDFNKLMLDWAPMVHGGRRLMGQKLYISDGVVYRLLKSNGTCNGCVFEDVPNCNCPNYIDSLCGFDIWVKDKDHVIMPRELTAENGGKGLMIGEFFEECSISNPACLYCMDDTEDGCNDCEAGPEVHVKVPVSWPTIKEIYKKAVDHFGDVKS